MSTTQEHQFVTVEVQCPNCGAEYQLPVADALAPLVEAEVVKRVTVSRQQMTEAIREMAQRESDDRNRVALAARDKTISDLRVELDELRRKIDSGAAIAAGEVQEQELEKNLRAAFPGDRISPVLRGVMGADIVQEVITQSGSVAGTIVWESKITRQYNPEWIPKLRKDVRAANASLGVIATVAMPHGVELFHRCDDVFVVAYRVAVPLAQVLRQTLIEVAVVRALNNAGSTVADKLLAYLSGNKFRTRVLGVIEAAVAMQRDLDSEKRSAARRWAQTQARIESVTACLAGMYGDLTATVGQQMLPSIPLLASGETERG